MKKFFLRNEQWVQGVKKAAGDLLAGRHRHDVLEDTIRLIEKDEAINSVGFGGYPNLEGVMELDAGFMDGDNFAIGAVAGVKNFLPVKIARRLMERNLHVLLAGTGAELFARTCDFTEEPTLSPAQKQKWQHDIEPRLARGPGSYMDLLQKLADPHKKNFDTVVMIAGDGNGLSAAASTSGWPYKFPGRVGDSPIAGAGFYVDSAYGGCVCTNTGEMAIRIHLAGSVVGLMAMGRPVHEAVEVALRRLSRLRTGLLYSLCVHAIDRDTNERVVVVNADGPKCYQYWREGMAQPECRVAERLNL